METITVKPEEGQALITIDGDLEKEDIPALKEAVERLLPEERKKQIYLVTKTSFLDSSALQFLLDQVKLAERQGGHLILAGASANLKEIFLLNGLAERFMFYDTLAQARAII